MAIDYVKALDNYTKLKKSEKKSKSTSTASKISKVDKQIKNYKTRLKAAGVDVEEATDKRNRFEKLTNLPEDQNWVFDAFELLGRPQQALFGAIDASQKGKDVGKGAWDAFSGKNRISGKDLIKNSNPDVTDRPGKIDFVDVGGFALDVLLDPLDLALIPVTGGANLAVSGAANAVDTAADVAKVASKADDIADIAKVASKVDNVADVAKTTRFISPNDAIFGAIGKGAKGTIKVADKGIDAALKAIDTLGDGGSHLADSYKAMKELSSKAFTYGKNIPKETLAKLRKTSGLDSRLRVELATLQDTTNKTIKEAAERIAKETGENVDDIIKTADKEVALLKGYEKYAKNKNTGANILSMAKDGRLPYNEKTKKIMNTLIDDLKDTPADLKFTENNGFVKLTGADWRNLTKSKIKKGDFSLQIKKAGTDDILTYGFDPEKINKKFSIGNFYNDVDKANLKKLLKSGKYNDGAYKDIYDAYVRQYDDANEAIKRIYGYDIAKDPNYDFRHTMNYDNERFKKYYLDSGILSEQDLDNMMLRGNTRVLGERKWDMSVQEANEVFKQRILSNYSDIAKKAASGDAKALKTKEFLDNPENLKLFKDTMSDSFQAYLDSVPKYVKNAKQIDNVFEESFMNSIAEQNRYKKLISDAKQKGDLTLALDLENQLNTFMDGQPVRIVKKNGKAPIGYVKLEKENINHIANKLRTIAEQTGQKSDAYNKIINTLKSNKNIAIDSDLLKMIDLSSVKEANSFLKGLDGALNFWKKNKTFSFTFHLNNLSGNVSNMWLSGMNGIDIPVYYKKAADMIDEAPKLMDKVVRYGTESITDKEAKILQDYLKYLDEGFGGLKDIFRGTELPKDLEVYVTGAKKITDFSGNKNALENLKQALNMIPAASARLNTQLDNASKLAVYKYGLDHPKYLNKLGVETAADAVRKVVFDPTELTSFENTWMKRFVPFYTFTKKNLAYHIDNITKNTTKYNRLMKSFNSINRSATDGNENNMADYLKNNMYIPLGGDGQGNYNMLKSQLPFGNVIEAATDPLGTIVNSSNPFVKGVFEQATNTNTFTDREISKFPGQKSTNIPFLTTKQENLLSNYTGLDVPLKQLNKIGQGLGTEGTAGDKTKSLLEGLFISKNDVEKDKLYKMYDELDELENTINLYKQEGYEISTINELKRANKNATIDKVQAYLNKMK